MNVLESIFNRVFPANHPAIAGVVPTENIPSPMAMPNGEGTMGGLGGAAAGVGPMGTGAVNEGTTANVSNAPIDVETILGGLAKGNAQTLNWRTSIVDLLKLLNLDSSLQARQTLAKELHYEGNMQDSAAMNTWLIQAVMDKLAENGGQIPAELKH